MKNYFKFLFKHCFLFLMLAIVLFLTSIIAVDIRNNNKSYYEATFEVSNIESFNYELLNDEDFLNNIKESGYNDKTNTNKYENIDIEKMLEKKHFSYTIIDNKVTIKTIVKYYDNFFNSKTLSVGSRAKTFIKDCAFAACTDENVIITFNNPDEIIVLKNSLNKWKISLIVLLITIFAEIVFSIILFLIKKPIVKEKYVYNNETIFSSSFYKQYWKLSLKPLIKVKDITTIAMLFALMMVCKFIPIPSGFGNLGLGITYLFFAIISMIYGPIYGFIVGVFSDVIGYFIDSNGGFFHLGYTFQAALTGFIYGLCFYKTKISFSKVFLCRLIINLLINVIYGSFLYVLVMYPDQIQEQGRLKELYSSYTLLLSLPKNIIWLLPQSLLLYYVIKIVSPTLIRFKLVDKEILDK